MKCKKCFIFVIGLMLILVFSSVDTIYATPGSGAIWTTNSCPDETQDENHYVWNNKVHINGANFDEATYEWYIIGKPGGASNHPRFKVAKGEFTVNATGAFCFNAYTIQFEDGGEYSVIFGSKNDNYRVIPTDSRTTK